MSISDRLDEMQARADNATDEPWEVGDGWVFTLPVYEDDQRLSNVLGVSFAVPERAAAERVRTQRNAEFIAHARTDVPALLAAVRAVLDACDRALAVTVDGSSDGDAAMAAFAAVAQRAIATALGEDTP